MIKVPIVNLVSKLESGDTLAGVELQVFNNNDLETPIATEVISTKDNNLAVFDYTPPVDQCSLRVRLITSVGGYQAYTPLTNIIQQTNKIENDQYVEPVVTSVTLRGEYVGLTCMNNYISITGNGSSYIVIIIGDDGFFYLFETNGSSVIPTVLSSSTVYTVQVYAKLNGYQSAVYERFVHTIQEEVDTFKILSVTEDKVSFTRPLGTESVEINMYNKEQHKTYHANAGGTVSIVPTIESNELNEWSIAATANMENGSNITVRKN